MIYEYHMERLENGTVQDQMNALAADGWRLIEVVAHPFETANAESIFVSFWERAVV